MDIRGTWYFSPKGDAECNKNFSLNFGNVCVHYTFMGWKNPLYTSFKGATGRLYSYTLFDSYHECSPHTYQTKFSETRVCLNQPHSPEFKLLNDGTDDVDPLPDSYFRQIDENTLKFNFREDISDGTCLIFVRHPKVEIPVYVVRRPLQVQRKHHEPENAAPERECHGELDST